MRMLMSTKNLPDTKKFLRWRDFFCDYYHEVDFLCNFDCPFEAEISETRFGQLALSRLSACGYKASNMKCRRPEDPKRNVQIIYQVCGSSFLYQDDRSVTLGPNDIVCFDNTRSSLFSADEFELLLLYVPYDLWNRRFGRSEQVTARVLNAGTGMGAVLGNYLQQLQLLKENEDLITNNGLENATLSLIAAAIGSLVPESESPKHTRRMALLFQAKMFIEKNLHNLDLNRHNIAAALDISESYLQALFRYENQSVDKWIWEMRLEKCRRDIANPMLSEKSLSEIAFTAGFNSFPHFSRKFKEAFQMTASEYRRTQHKRH